MNALLHDLRFASRAVVAQPLPSLLAFLSLSLAIALLTAAVSIGDRALVRTLPAANPDQLVVPLWHAGTEFPAMSASGSVAFDDAGRSSSTSFPLAAWERFAADAKSVRNLVAFSSIDRINATADSGSFVATGHSVSGNYFSFFELRPAAGRLLAVADDRAGAEPVVVLSHRFWHARFGGATDVIGRTLRLNGIAFVIVGVTPAGFHGSVDIQSDSDLFVTLHGHALLARDPSMMTNATCWWVQLLGRTTDANRGSAELTQLMRAFMRETRPSYPQVQEMRVELLPGARGLDESRSSFRTPIVLLAALLVVLFILACTNVANLQLARALRRRRETATRLALGAPRGRVIRQTLFESVILTVGAAAFALLITPSMSSLMLRMLPGRDAAVAIDTNVDARVAAFALLAALVGGIVLGLPPALRGTGDSLAGALRGRGGSQASSRLAKSLVVAQIAMSVALLVTSAVLVRSVRNIDRIPLGYNPENVLQFRLAPGPNGYSAERRREIARRVSEEVGTIPGVSGITQSSSGVLTGQSMMTDTSVRNASTGATVPRGYIRVNLVDAAFLDTMQIVLLRGRGIAASDGEGAPLVTVLDEAAAKSIFGEQEALGKVFTMLDHDYQVVGVVRDAKYTRVRDEEGRVAYASLAQHADRVETLTFDVRTRVTPSSVIPAIREAVLAIDSDLPLFEVESQRGLVERSTRQERSFALLATAVGSIATLLACAGLYALLSYLVSGRTTETGVRMALGAARRDIVRLVMRDCAVLVAWGVALGIPCAMLAGRVSQQLLYQVSPRDPLSTAIAALLMLGVACAASAIPAWRAASVDPVVALRGE